MQKKTFLTIGATNSRRVKFWENALQQQRCNHRLITFNQVIDNDFPEIETPTILRITSPGEDFNLWKKIASLGGYKETEKLVFKRGLIYPNQYWYRGWCVILKKIEGFIEKNPLVEVMNTPASIQLAFHKLESQKVMAKQGISIPKIIMNQVEDYDALIDMLEIEKIPQVFIKPYHGSSASGVMALRQSKGRQVLYTTIALQANGEMYNHLQLQKYDDLSKIKRIVNSMIPSGLLVENWIRKKRFQQKSVDFRILVINGKPIFVVPRMSKHFITNLHLGNEKGNVEEVELIWGKKIIQKAKTLAVNAVDVIGGLFYAGVDVAINAIGESYVLEINAFGDMLLGIDQDGFNTYEYELRELLV